MKKPPKLAKQDIDDLDVLSKKCAVDMIRDFVDDAPDLPIKIEGADAQQIKVAVLLGACTILLEQATKVVDREVAALSDAERAELKSQGQALGLVPTDREEKTWN